ncbi:MAG: hypothetical protein LBJ43_05600 [Propionibacteriaceae bacterium]|jgi:hypothetical protein|nr:hypothetical protein [Propionibacteriaceae bacterium]
MNEVSIPGNISNFDGTVVDAKVSDNVIANASSNIGTPTTAANALQSGAPNANTPTGAVTDTSAVDTLLAQATAELQAAETEWRKFRRQLPLGTDDLRQYEIRMYQQFGTGTKKEFAAMKSRLLQARAAFAAATRATNETPSFS